MSILHVLDVSALVHTGTSVCDDSYYGCPVGGLRYLNRYICQAFVRENDIVLAFDSPSFRNELLGEYKSGRNKNVSVISQIEIAYEMLSSCGVKCEKHDGYEADDIIEWAVQAGEANEDYYQIMIHGNDYDLCHSIRPNVKFCGCSSNVASVTAGNFSTAVAKGEFVKYNTISAYKVFCGCSSDKIPELRLESGKHGKELYKQFVEFTDANGIYNYEFTSTYKTILYFASQVDLFTENDMNELYRRIKLVFPAEKPEDVLINPTKFYTVNQKKLIQYFALCGDVASLRCMSAGKVTLSESEKEYLKERGRMLSSGIYAADNNLEPSLNNTVKASALTLDAFSRDF